MVFHYTVSPPSKGIWSNWKVKELSLPEDYSYRQPLRGVRLLETESHRQNLVVVLHGLDFHRPLPGQRVDCDRLNSFIKMLLLPTIETSNDPLANVLLIDYHNDLFVRGKTAEKLAAAVSAVIGDAHANAGSGIGYKTIILLGHSFGSLLARRVMVEAAESKEHWCKHATGLISLAGTNLGFKIDKVNSWKLRIFSAAAGITGLVAPWLVEALNSLGPGRLASYSWRNSPWVVDTRIKWLRLYEGEIKAANSIKIKTLSVIGTKDALVGQDDQEMVYQLGNYCCTRTIEGVRHEGFLDPAVNTESHAAQKTNKANLQSDMQFLLDPSAKKPDSWEEVTRVSRLHADAASDEEDRDRTVVFLIHGIRDNAEWQEDIDYNLRKIHNKQHMNSRLFKPKILISQIRYGYFSALQFLFPSERRRAIRSFSDEYLRTMARFPDLKQENIHVYAHSNGTFVFGEALRKYREIRVNRVLLGGSVLPPNFPWEEYVNSLPQDKYSKENNLPTGRQVMEIVNYAANKDWPTGLLCRGLGFIRLPLPKQPPLLGIGPGGTDGFKDLCNYKEQGKKGSVRGWNFFLDGDHGATLATGHQSPKGLATYLLGAKPGTSSKGYSFEDLNKSENPIHPLNRGITKSYPSPYHRIHGNLLAVAVLIVALYIFLLFLIGSPLIAPVGHYKILLNAIVVLLFMYILSRL